MISPALTAAQRLAPQPLVLTGGGVALTRRVPIVKQDIHPSAQGLASSYTCGPTCVEAVRQYWNPARTVLLDEWSTVQQTAVNAALRGAWYPATPSVSWCNPNAMADTLMQDGLNVRVETGQPIATALARWLANGDTVIIHQALDGWSHASGHYCVVEAIDATGVHLMDPEPTHPTNPHVPWSTFLARYHNAIAPGGLAIRANRGPL